MNWILVTYRQDFGRMGSLDGLFITRPEVLELLYGAKCYFGEVLGKHSDIWADLKPEHFTVHGVDSLIQLNPLTTAATEGDWHTITGYNPLDYIDEADLESTMEESK
jgi:hypothetical protein